ncbi:hypothetical protein ACEQ8H_002210 [Pleosporales sp. CAS-2024a]
MSFKAKDVHFEKEEPAFLRRLRGQLTSGDSARHEQPIPRNKRLTKDDDDDDAPTYVLEDSKESLTKEQYEALVSGKAAAEMDDAATAEQVNQEPGPKQKDKIAEVGAGTRKRKAAKIVGEEVADEQAKKSKHVEQSTEGKAGDATTGKKTKKKVKTVKLTFADDET